MADIFSEVVNQTVDVDSVTLETLVGDGKKYKEANDLAKAKVHGDLHISKLEKELAEIRQELNKRATMEELMDKIKTPVVPPVTPSAPQVPQAPDSQTPDVNKLVKEAFEAQTAEARRSANLQQVTQKLVERFGDAAQIHLNKKAAELGVSLEYLQSQAKENPSVFYRLIELDRPQQAVPPVVTAKSNAVLPQGTGERDKRYWDQIKAKDVKFYFSPEGYKERYKDMEKALKAGKQWE